MSPVLPEPLNEAYRNALLAHQSGRLPEAIAGYWRVLALDPSHADALYLLGLARHQSGDTVGGEAQILQAIQLREDAFFLEVLARLRQEQNRFDEAEDGYRRVLALLPDSAAALCNLGVLLRATGRLQEAESTLRKAIACHPALVEGHFNLGNLYSEQGRASEAEGAYRHVTAIAPGHAPAHNNLGDVLLRNRRLAEALQAYLRAAELCPDMAEYHYNLANVLRMSHRYPEAEGCYRRALALHPDYAAARFNLAKLLEESGRLAAAESAYRSIIAHDCGAFESQWNLAHLLLSLGRYEEAWPYYESRYNTAWRDAPVRPPAFSFPQWRGESLVGKSLLVVPEQGYGDYIQFVRYAGLAKAAGAARVTLACDAGLRALFAGIDAVDVVSCDRGDPGRHDYWTFPLSFPRWFHTSIDDIPAPLPYLHASPERIRRWRDCLPPAEFRVGLVWRGNPGHENDAVRSLDRLSRLAPLWQFPGVSFVSLQVGKLSDEDMAVMQRHGILPLGRHLRDFADTAAIISQLDLVISVDTAVAHLAGAMACPCWLLLSAEKSDWRWLRNRTDSPWYPGSIRIFRQASLGNWSDPVDELVDVFGDTTRRGARRKHTASEASGERLPAGRNDGDWPTEVHVFYVHSPITYSIALATIKYLGLAHPVLVGGRSISGEGIAAGVEDDGVWSIPGAVALLDAIAAQLPPDTLIHLYLPHTAFLFGKLVKFSQRVARIYYLEEGYTSSMAAALSKPVAAVVRVAVEELMAALERSGARQAWRIDQAEIERINACPDCVFDIQSNKYGGAFAYSPDAFLGMRSVIRVPLEVLENRQAASLVSIAALSNCPDWHKQRDDLCHQALQLILQLRGESPESRCLLKLHPMDYGRLPAWFCQRLADLRLDYDAYCDSCGIDARLEPAQLNFQHYHVVGVSAQRKYVELLLGSHRLTQHFLPQP